MANLSPGQGWLDANLSVDQAGDKTGTISAGYQVNKNLDLFGDAYADFTKGTYGADVGAEVGKMVDLYAGGWAGGSDSGVQAGVKVLF